MREQNYLPKCNFSISVPIDILEKLNELTSKNNSRSKLVNEAIYYWLKNVAKVI